jgi:hypothetical protein
MDLTQEETALDRKYARRIPVDLRRYILPELSRIETSAEIYIWSCMSVRHALGSPRQNDIAVLKGDLCV